MSRFSTEERASLYQQYLDMKRCGVTETEAARRLGVSYMTVLRWRKSFGTPINGSADHVISIAPAEGGQAIPATPYQLEIPRSVSETEWLRELASRLLLENERLKAQLSGTFRNR